MRTLHMPGAGLLGRWVLALATLLLSLATLPLPTQAAAFPLDPAAAPFDLTGDGFIDMADVQEVVLARNDQLDISSPCANLIAPSRDVNHDGCIDIADVQAVAAWLGTQVRPSSSAATTATSAAATTSSSALTTQATTGATFTVNSTSDADDATPGDGICATSAGVCSLRAAITEANLASGPNTITFNIPGSGVHTIVITSTLPTISDQNGPLTIDGYSQPGSSPNTDPVVSNAVINVLISGAVSEPNISCTSASCNLTNAIRISSPNNVIRGLALYKVRRPFWLSGDGAHDNVIAGNFIGTNPSGQSWATKSYNVAFGIAIKDGPSNNRFGGTAPADRNVISGNSQDGANLSGEGITGNQFLDNLMGLTPNGKGRLQNRGQAIDLNYGTQSTLIDGNIISGNFRDGIEISHGTNTAYNRVTNNLIGTNLTGTGGGSVYQNGGYGIDFEDAASNNTVANNVIANDANGGVLIYGALDSTFPKLNNQITNNRLGVGRNGEAIPSGPDGVLIRLGAIGNVVGPGNIISNFDVGVHIIDDDVRENTVTRNSIFGNSGLGIDIEPTGVNLNDQYSHNGPNDRLNFPVIATATTTQVAGTACAGCTVELFASDHDPSGYGEGKTFVGSAVASGSGTFTATVSGLTTSDTVTSTATDADGNTSEFSANAPVSSSGFTPPTAQLPGQFQAEDYKLGGEGMGYHDTTAGNTGGAYRADDVDIQATTDAGGGYNVGWIASGEWLAYDVNVASAGNYVFTFRVATTTSGRQLHLILDGSPLSGGSVNIPLTGGWQSWTNVSTGPIALPAGSHELRIVMDTNNFNLNYVSVASSP